MKPTNTPASKSTASTQLPSKSEKRTNGGNLG